MVISYWVISYWVIGDWVIGARRVPFLALVANLYATLKSYIISAIDTRAAKFVLFITTGYYLTPHFVAKFTSQ